MKITDYRLQITGSYQISDIRLASRFVGLFVRNVCLSASGGGV